jgi:hypothetical protein
VGVEEKTGAEALSRGEQEAATRAVLARSGDKRERERERERFQSGVFYESPGGESDRV